MKRIFGCVMVVMLLGIVLLLAQSFGGNGHETVKSLNKNKKGVVMKGYLQDIESIATKNTDFRRVLYTTKQSQLVLMALKPGEEIGAEVHKSDQFFRVEEGSGKAVLDNVTTEVRAGFGVFFSMSKKLFVGGLSWGTTDDGLHQAFERFGEIVEAKVIPTGKPAVHVASVS